MATSERIDLFAVFNFEIQIDGINALIQCKVLSWRELRRKTLESPYWGSEISMLEKPRNLYPLMLLVFHLYVDRANI